MHTALVCAKDIRTREALKTALYALGLREVLVCNQRDNALELAIDHSPQLVLLESTPPVSGLELAVTIRNSISTLSILLVDHDIETPFKQAAASPIDAFLAKPLLQPDLQLALELAIHTAHQIAALRQELETTQSALKQRKVVERAKGLLMEREGITEEQAFKKMRSLAMTRRISIGAVAEEIIDQLRR